MEEGLVQSHHRDNHAAQSLPGREERTFEQALLLGEIARAHPWQATSKADSPAILVPRRLKSLTKTKEPYAPGRFIVLSEGLP
jgi:hypothetical protein